MAEVTTFTLNGSTSSYKGNQSARLLDVLRDEYKLTGVKCGCKEGECGACAVIKDGKLINSCMVAMGSIAGSEITTIEGYKKTDRFAALDRAFAKTSAVQCGYCMPAMALAIECLLSENHAPSEEEIRRGISGNLCRCTGYNAIVKAAMLAAEESGELWQNSVKAAKAAFGFTPKNLDEALEIRAARNAIPYGGGTDLMIKADPDADYLFLENIEELKRVYEDLEFIHFSAGCTFSELLKNSLAPGILKEALKGIAAPAIRNFGTIGGNIANGSAKADSALVFIAADSKIKLQSVRGERVIPLKSFYLGRKRTALEKDEIATEVLMPKKWLNCCSYHKVGARKALAISRISFAGFFSVEKGKIAHNAVAFGAVEDVFIRRPDLDEMLLGLTLEEAKKAKPKYLKAYEDAINPTEGRVSASYRKAVCLNLLGEFIDSMLKREYS